MTKSLARPKTLTLTVDAYESFAFAVRTPSASSVSSARVVPSLLTAPIIGRNGRPVVSPWAARTGNSALGMNAPVAPRKRTAKKLMTLARVPAYGVAAVIATPDAVEPASTAVLMTVSDAWAYASFRSCRSIAWAAGSAPSMTWRDTSVYAPYMSGVALTAVVAKSVELSAAPSADWTATVVLVVTFGNWRTRASA